MIGGVKKCVRPGQSCRCFYYDNVQISARVFFFEPNKRNGTNPPGFCSDNVRGRYTIQQVMVGEGVNENRKCFRDTTRLRRINDVSSERLRVYRVHICADLFWSKRPRDKFTAYGKHEGQDGQTYRKINSNKFRTSRVPGMR